MKQIYLGKKEEPKVKIMEFRIDPVPPKSTYMDRNRSNIKVSETFKAPSDDVMNKLYEEAAKFFKMIAKGSEYQKNKERENMLFVAN